MWHEEQTYSPFILLMADNQSMVTTFRLKSYLMQNWFIFILVCPWFFLRDTEVNTEGLSTYIPQMSTLKNNNNKETKQNKKTNYKKNYILTAFFFAHPHWNAISVPLSHAG